MVLPFLLPDTPVVAWWPGVAAGRSRAGSVGPVGDSPDHRRHRRAPIRWRAIKSRLEGYTAGDTDLAWSRITYWRALLTSALDQPPYEPVTSALVSGLKNEPALDILAGWLASRIDGPVQRAVGELKVELVRPSETITLSRPQDGVTATLTRTARPDAQLPLARRETRECLAEDLRRLDADEIYHEALAGHRQGAVRLMSDVVVETYPDTAALVAAAGDRLVEAITAAIAARGPALIVLTGGGTGIGLLKHVGAHDDEIDWSKVHLFWGDERFVPADDDERNDKQAREALLDHIDIPAGNVHAMPASDGEFGDDLDAAAAAYEQVLAENAEPGAPAPVFDVHLLGMGGEGHVNSLFPHTAAARETERMVVGVTDSPKPPPRRITLTLPAVHRSREVWLVVAGEAKADAVAAAIGGANPDDVPAAGASGTRGHGVASRRRRGEQAAD